MRTTEVFDVVRNELHVVPEPELTHVQFCDLARQAWTTIRERLRLPDVDPVFVWQDKGRQEHHVGDVIVVPAADGHMRPVTFNTLRYALIGPTDDCAAKLQELAHIVACDRPIVRFGALPMPCGIYYAVILACVDAARFSLRVLHVWDRGGWVTRVDLLLATEPATEHALTAVLPICPRCYSPAIFLRSQYEAGGDVPPNPTEPVPVECGCGWHGVSPRARN